MKTSIVAVLRYFLRGIVVLFFIGFSSSACVESEESPRLDPADVVRIAGLEGLWTGWKEDKNGFSLYNIVPLPNKHYKIEFFQLDPSTKAVTAGAEDNLALILKTADLAKQAGKTSYVDVAFLPLESTEPDTKCFLAIVGGKRVQYLEFHQTEYDIWWGIYVPEKTDDQSRYRTLKIAEAHGITLEVKETVISLKGALTSKNLRAVFNDKTFRSGFKLMSLVGARQGSLDEMLMFAEAGYVAKDPRTSSKQVAADLTDSSQSRSMGGSAAGSLEEMAASGDLWAKYFLASAHVYKAAGGSRERLLTAKFEGQGLPDNVRADWNKFQDFIRDWTFEGSYAAAERLIKEGIKHEFGPLIRLLASQKMWGRGMPVNEREAVELFRRAADRGDVEAMNLVGWSYETGHGVSVNNEEAFRWYQRSADRGYAEAFLHLGWMYGNGIFVAKNDEKATRLYQQAAELGETTAMSNVGWAHKTGSGISKDAGKALYWFQQCANAYNPRCMADLGTFYALGDGVAKDDAKAVTWFREAAKAENPLAMNWLGAMYEKGRSIPKDLSQAFYWYKKSAERGHANGMLDLSRMYDAGLGVSMDKVEAVRWNRMAAEQGHPPAMQRLGGRYYSGDGVPKNYTEAARWIGKAAETGDSYAMADLGSLYAMGRGVSQNNKMAKDWLLRARATSNDPDFNRKIDGFIEKMESDSSEAGWAFALGLFGAAMALSGNSSGQSDSVSEEKYKPPKPPDHLCRDSALEMLFGSLPKPYGC